MTAPKLLKLVSALALAGTIGCRVQSGAAQTAQTEQNLVVNPGFEQVHGGVPDSWVLDPALRSRGILRASTEQHASGRTSLELAPNRENNQKDKPFGIGQIVSAQDIRGRRIQISAALRVTSGAAAGLLVLAVSGGRASSQAIAMQASPTQGFEVKTASLDVGPDVDQLIVGCIVNGTSGRAWFDDVYVGPGQPPLAEVEPRSSGAEFSAMVRINANKVLKPIDRKLFGANLTWVFNADGSWDERQGRIRSEVVQAARDLGVSVIRFPGGTFADYYHWRDGVGPPSSRRETPHYTDDNRSRHVVGTDEIARFAQEIGAEVLLGVNITTGSAREAAEWVAYCNQPSNSERTRNGRTDAYPVRFWEIGNEQYIKEGVQSTRKAYLSAAEYAKRYLEFAAAMKAVDPTIRLLAIGGVNTREYKLLEDESWTRILLQRAGHAIDYLAVHNAYAPPGASTSGASFEEVYQAMLGFPVLISENLQAVNQEIERSAPGDANRIRIAITEWGPFFNNQPSDPWVAHGKTLGSALFVASAMQSFLRADRVDMANFFKLTEHAFMGWTDNRGTPKPSYYALQMYTRHFGEKLIEATVDSPTFASRRVGVIDAVSAAPYLDAVGSLSADGSTLYLIVVNRNFKQNSRTRLQIAGFQPKRSGRVWVLTGPSLDANNGEDLPNIPGLKWGRQVEAPRGSMFRSGKPGAVAPVEGSIQAAASSFEYSFPRMSVTALELTRSN